MVSFNKIQKMIDGKWFVKGICFDGDELPLNLNGEEIACGSEIYEVDTGKTFFYFQYESEQGVWINKGLLDFSDGKYKYIYPQSMEELNAVASRHALEFTGIKTSDILLPDFVPSIQLADLPWLQLPLGNIIICIPFVEDNAVFQVFYYDGDTLDQIGMEGVTEGEYPTHIPGGYDYWTESPVREGDRIIVENEQIFDTREFYGWVEEEEEGTLYRYPINAYEYLHGNYSGETLASEAAENAMFIPEGAQFISWDPVSGQNYYKPKIESNYDFLYYYPINEQEYNGPQEGWSGLEYTNNPSQEAEIAYTPSGIYIPAGHVLGEWFFDADTYMVSVYTPIYILNPDDEPEPDS